eukprot:g2482.t1
MGNRKSSKRADSTDDIFKKIHDDARKVNEDSRKVCSEIRGIVNEQEDIMKKLEFWNAEVTRVAIFLRSLEACNRVISIVKGHSGSVLCIQATEKYIITGGSDGFIYLWDIDGKGQEPGIEKKSREILKIACPQKVTSICTTPNGKILVAGLSNGSTFLWNLESGKKIASYQRHYLPVTSVACTRNRLATGSEDRTAMVCGIRNRRGKGRVVGRHGDGILCLTFSNDGKHLFTGSRDCSAICWNVLNGSTVMWYEAHTGWVTSISICRSDKLLLTGSKDRRIILWDVALATELRTFVGHTAGVTSVTFLPHDCRYIASASADNSTILWNLASARRAHTFKDNDTKSINAICATPDGSRLVVGTEAGYTLQYKIFDILDGRITLLHALRTLNSGAPKGTTQHSASRAYCTRNSGGVRYLMCCVVRFVK